MTQPYRQNIYDLLKNEFKTFEILIDVGCTGLYDLLNFEDSQFKRLIGIDKEFETTPFGDYKRRKKERLFLTRDELRQMSGALLNSFNNRFEIVKGSVFDYNFGIDKNSFIICNKVLHFFDNKLKLELIDKFYNSLTNGGLLFLKINHFKHPNNTDLTKVDPIDDTTYRSKEDSNDIRYLIVPDLFISSLMNKYDIISKYIMVDEKTLTVVIRK